MAHTGLRGVINKTGCAATLMVSLASFFACAPSSGGSDRTAPLGTSAHPGGGGPAGGNGAGGAPPNGGAPSGASGMISQGGIVGQGGIPPQGGTGNGGSGNGGFFPNDGGFGNGGFGNTGGIPPGAGGTCGMNETDPSTYPPCTTCTGGRCVPTDLLQGNPAVTLLAACDATSACVPEQIVAQGGNLLLHTCRSIGGSEGRCTSLCIPAASNLSAYLPQDVCAPTERCVPCFSPNDGSDIGICGLGCDPPPTSTPYVFGTCCAGAGRCAPSSALPPDTAKNLGQETCQSGELCVPGAPISNPAYRFPCCMTGLNNTVSGICAPACVIDQTALGRSLTTGTCGGGDKCVPCSNPLNGQPTGGCTDTRGQVVTTCVP